MQYPHALQDLIDRLSDLPSVGPKTAERYAFYLLKQNPDKTIALAESLKGLSSDLTVCQSCHAISASDPCPICNDRTRQKQVLCIVENLPDLIAIENTRQYTGRYFVLGGLINTVDEIGPKDLNIDKLIKKIKQDGIKEIILALNFTLEGETTTMYLTKLLKDHIKITRLAKGLPAGSDLEYADEITLGSALKNRNEIK